MFNKPVSSLLNRLKGDRHRSLKESKVDTSSVIGFVVIIRNRINDRL